MRLSSLLLAQEPGVLARLGTSSRLRVRAVGNGILGLFFYVYGIYAMERVYTWLYPVYLAIFGMSLYALVYGIATASADARGKLRVAAPARVAGAVFGIVIAVMFNVIWFSQLVPLLRAGDRIDYLYSIYVTDLSFVMPAFVIAAVLALRRHPMGLLGLPGLFVLGAGILSPLALAEFVKPGRYGMERNARDLSLYLVLSILFAAFTVLHLVSTKVIRE